MLHIAVDITLLSILFSVVYKEYYRKYLTVICKLMINV